LVAAANFLVAAKKNVVPYFVAVPKPFFSVRVRKPDMFWIHNTNPATRANKIGEALRPYYHSLAYHLN